MIVFRIASSLVLRLFRRKAKAVSTVNTSCELLLVEKIKSNYRIIEFGNLSTHYDEKFSQFLLPTIVTRIKEYFGDMYLAMKEFKIILKPNAYALLVVGDQTYKNIIIPVGKIFVEIAKDLGYSSTDIELFRVRRSTIHSISLNEEIVILKN